MNERPEKSPELQPGAIRAARTALGSMAAKPLATWLTVGVATGLFLALVGALGSYNYSLLFRLGFWQALSLTGAAVAAGLEFLIGKIRWKTGHRYPRWLVLIGLFALVMTPVAYLANSTGGLRPWGDLLMYFQNSVVISSVFVAMRLLLGELYRGRARAALDRADRNDTAAFMQRLPLSLRKGRLHALFAEGHYIRVYTDLGSDLVLFRLKDAVRELRSLQGMQVHRSWWVARSAIKDSGRENGRLWLTLEGDIRVPVSRPNVKKLRELGWL
ncbi:MAG: hypothetical protein HKN15_07580 [Xanthomonadales bacterium]|nr:hypothetical protein [Xanthomonadales bacterium]